MAESTIPDSIKIQLFQAEMKRLPPAISNLLSSYSDIPVSQQKEHITAVRDQAYKSYPYPCLGRWRFLELDLATHPLYHSDILPKLKESSGPLFLDLGCCLGQDVRKLIFDGADPARLYGADLRPEFIDMGYKLFQDDTKFPKNVHFISPADVFDFSRESELSQKCDGKVGILHSTAVFHLFDWDQELKMASRCLQLVTRNHGRVLICGAQVGNIEAGEVPRYGGGSRYRHNEESWKRLWEEVLEKDPETRNKIKTIEVHSELEERNFDRFREDTEAATAGGKSGNGDEGQIGRNNEQRQVGSIEKGFRWMKWWVWIDFA